MGHTLEGMINGLSRVAGYGPEFEKAFGTAEITAKRVSHAIASYERTVLTGHSPFDRYQAGDKNAMSVSAVRGMEIFNDPAGGNCVTCHAGFNFTDESYHNLGVGFDRPEPDLGRFEITKFEADRGAFKTPTLRNVAESAPYMHDGSKATLLDVVNFYERGGNANPWHTEAIKALELSDQEKADLVAFLESLSGEIRGGGRPSSLP